MAEEKKRPTLNNAEGHQAAKTAAKEGTLSPATGNATGLRIGAIVLWVAAIVFELLAVLILFGKLNITFLPTLAVLIILLVLDLACVIIAAQLWKKANHIRPASEKNKLLFWLWNNMGVVVACFAFVPVIIIMLTNKELDKKTKTIATIAAIVALLIGTAASIDYNPISQEQLEAAGEAVTGLVYWTPYGKVYHTYVVTDADDAVTESCPHLNRSDSLNWGGVEEAVAAGRTRLCSWCARHDGISTEGLLTDGSDVSGEAAEYE
ncbi:MAG: hypothetical protein IJ705_08410 [Oscillospiraceae bacterium]|nr:hypothetical protein [Oscillospiraceae bacterium]